MDAPPTSHSLLSLTRRLDLEYVIRTMWGLRDSVTKEKKFGRSKTVQDTHEHTCSTTDESINQQPIRQSNNQPTSNQSIKQSNNQIINQQNNNQSTNQPTDQPINQPTNRPTNQSTNHQPINQPTNRPINQPTNQATCVLVNDLTVTVGHDIAEQT